MGGQERNLTILDIRNSFRISLVRKLTPHSASHNFFSFPSLCAMGTAGGRGCGECRSSAASVPPGAPGRELIHNSWQRSSGETGRNGPREQSVPERCRQFPRPCRRGAQPGDRGHPGGHSAAGDSGGQSWGRRNFSGGGGGGRRDGGGVWETVGFVSSQIVFQKHLQAKEIEPGVLDSGI